MTLPVLVIGGGGHARVLIEALLASSAVIAGVVDSDPALAMSRVLGVPVIGGDEVVGEFPPSEILLVNGLGSTGLPATRRRVFDEFRGRGSRFASVLHPSAVVASDVVLHEGAQVMAGVVIQPGASIGLNSIVNTRASVDHDCIISAHVHVAPGVTMSGGVRGGEGTHIGTAAAVIQGISIGCGCLVAAGAVVTRDIADGTKVRGVPAREFA